MLKAFIIISDDIPHVACDLLLLPWVCVCGCIVSRIIAAVTRLSPGQCPRLTMAGCWLPAIFCFPVTGGCSRCSRLWPASAAASLWSPPRPGQVSSPPRVPATQVTTSYRKIKYKSAKQ